MARNVTPQQLFENYPVLHHMAQAGSWPAISKIGLRTSIQLVDACGVSAVERSEILDGQRKKSYTLTHPVAGTITIRDQQPLKMHNLVPKLDGITLEEFLTSLNDRVFMWAHPERLDRLLDANLYRNHLHDVLVIDTASLVAAHADAVRLAGMNTGATIFPNTPPRTPTTFSTVADYPFDERSKTKKLIDNVVEVCVLGGVDDIVEHVVRVESRRGPVVEAVVYDRETP